MTSEEAAAYAKVSINTIRDAAACGDLSGTKITPDSTRSRWRFLPSNVDEWLERGRVTNLRRPRRRGAA